MEACCKRKVPGWDTFPEYAFQCETCGMEFEVAIKPEEEESQKCLSCGSSSLKLRYISYPTDGPGFQDGYDPTGLIYGGGATEKKDGFDIAGLPLMDICYKK